MSKHLIRIGHRLLDNSVIYDLFQNAVGSSQNIQNLTKSALTSNFSYVLDLGCGTGRAISQLAHNSNYIGIDLSQKYLEKAEKINSSSNIQLVKSDVVSKSWLDKISLDNEFSGLAWGLYHHLSDYQLFSLLENMQSVLKSGSILNSMDPVIVESSTKGAIWVAKNDRGKYLREPEELKEILNQHGFDVEYEIRRNAIRIPVDLLLARAIKR
jgi:SAM-dependent methyltransferase